MARKQVVEIICDRCEKQEYVSPKDATETPDFEGQLLGEKLKYDDLCTRCKGTLRNYYAKIAKKEEASDEAPSSSGPGGESPRPPMPPVPPGGSAASGQSTTSRRPTT